MDTGKGEEITNFDRILQSCEVYALSYQSSVAYSRPSINMVHNVACRLVKALPQKRAQSSKNRRLSVDVFEVVTSPKPEETELCQGIRRVTRSSKQENKRNTSLALPV